MKPSKKISKLLQVVDWLRQNAGDEVVNEELLLIYANKILLGHDADIDSTMTKEYPAVPNYYSKDVDKMIDGTNFLLLRYEARPIDEEEDDE